MRLNLDDIVNSIDGLKGLEVYLTNSFTFEINGQDFEITNQTSRVNNLSYEESEKIIHTFSELSKETNLPINIAQISFHFFELFVNNFSFKTSSNILIDIHTITFKI